MKKGLKFTLLAFLFLSSCDVQISIGSNNTNNIESINSETINSNISYESNNSSNEEIISSEENNSILDSTSSEVISSEDRPISNNKLEHLTILSINDLHGKIEQDDSGLQGISNLSYKINTYRNQNELDDVILIANGDMFQGQAISNLNHGKSVINAMNAMDFDIMGIGNHEFDWGIDTVLNYFDGNEENGEANFPLVNANIIKNDTKELLEYTKPYEIVYKENIKIGIISTIGVDQSSSILKPLMDPYSFTDVTAAVGKYAEILRKDEKCDFVICNIHDGDTNYDTTVNKSLANLTGNKRIDALINGHSHYKYRGYITRSDGSASLPVIQAGANGNALGVIDLYFDKDTKVISSVNAFYNQEQNTSYDEVVQEIVDNDYELLKDQLEEVYCVSGETVTSTSKLRSWAGSCIQKATDADIAFSNNGGLRNVNLSSNKNITVSDLYEIMPFDNKILIAEVSGYQINSFIDKYSSSNYYSIKKGLTIENSYSVYYKVAVIDYLGYKSYFPLGDDYIDSGLLYRDLMGEDLRLRHKNGDKFYPSSNPESILNCLI